MNSCSLRSGDHRCIFLVLLILFGSSACAEENSIDYATQVHPVLQKYCAGCHNDNDLEGDLSVQTFVGLQKGGENGKSFVASNSNNSRIVQRIHATDDSVMPPEDEPRPSEKEIALISAWIGQGAVGPKQPIKRELVVPKIEAPDMTPAVTSVDWSSKNVIAVSRFGSVEFLDGDTLKVVRTLDSFPGKVNAVRFSTDGKRLCVASGVAGLSGQATVWNVADGSNLATIEGHNDTIYQTLESPDGKLIATASYDQKIVLWDARSGNVVRELTGHNDAVYDLDFSRDSKHLISASGDQTIKVWDVATGGRLDTLGQPLKEQFTTRFSPDGKVIVGGGRDNRIRVWEFVSRESAQVNPLLHARFAHGDSIVGLDFSADGKRLVSTSEDKTIKVWSTTRFEQIGQIEDQSEVCVALAISPTGESVFVGRLDGSTERIAFPPLAESVGSVAGLPIASPSVSDDSKEELAKVEESEPNGMATKANSVTLPVIASGRIYGDSGTDVDVYRFAAKARSPLLLSIKAARDESPLDSRIEILDAEGAPVPRVVLRAVRDSYFTFRGKASDQTGDFRIHNWQEMNLNDYLYCSGEVVKLFHRPRGPDSGFNVYPGGGKRYGYFGTTGTSHALHEPCYIVRPYPIGTEFQPNGLPTFELNYENDDDSRRELGADSRLMFTPPADGEYLVRVSDVRGFQGEDFKYELQIAAPKPDYSVKLSHASELHPGSGQEFSIKATRKEGFDGEIRVDIDNVPESLSITTGLIIEANHHEAFGAIHLKAGASVTEEELAAMKVRATAQIGERTVEHDVNGFGKIEVKDKPQIQVRIVKMETTVADVFEAKEKDVVGEVEPVVFDVRPGEKFKAKIVVNRIDHNGRISFGNETSGRNMPHGVYVDDIGLNGLMITEGNVEQRFFVTVEPWVKPMKRLFHIKSSEAGKQASWPVMINVLPK